MLSKFITMLFILTNLFSEIQLAKDETPTTWKNMGETDLKAALEKKIINGIAKNVILFVGDGMGLTTVTASRIYGKGEKGFLAFEKFSNIGLLKTYSANKLVPDSCSTATALFCGVKVNHKTSGVDATVGEDNCNSSLNKNAQLGSIIAWAQKAKKSTGFVTTTRVTHATPSALYAHTPNRNWECESTMPKSASRCKDIARQLVEDLPGKDIEVIMGGGRQCLQANVTSSVSDPIDTWSCYSKDGRDLIKDWKSDKRKRLLTHAFVSNNEELNKLDINTKYVLGIFAAGHLKMNHARDKGPKGMPSLRDMTEKATEVLQKNENGFLLVVEGGMIDFGHHRGKARKALDETVAFSDAIERALQITNEQETLVIVTSDHAHSLVFTGYPSRDQNILGTAQASKIDSVPYTSLLYGTGGPNNYQYTVVDNKVNRPNPEDYNTTSFEYSQQAAVVTDEVTHSGTDVVVYANGPMAHLFTSVHENTYVAYVISAVAKIGPFADMLETPNKSDSITCSLIIFVLVIVTGLNKLFILYYVVFYFNTNINTYFPYFKSPNFPHYCIINTCLINFLSFYYILLSITKLATTTITYYVVKTRKMQYTY